MKRSVRGAVILASFLLLGFAFLAVSVSEGSPGLPTGDGETSGEGAAGPGPSGAEAVLEETGTIGGKVLFTGPKPTQEKIDLGSEPVCQGAHEGGKLFQEHEILNPDGTLQNVFVYVKDGLGDRKFDVPKEPVVIDQKGCQYIPHVFGIQVKQPLKILNSDAVLHNVHSMPKKNRSFNSAMPRKGMEIKKKFRKPEVPVYIKCEIHSWMNTYACVVTHPFYFVTGDKGTYELKGLPPGEYTIEAFHEKWGKLEREVTVKAGETAAADFTYDGKESHLIHKPKK